MKTTRLSDSDLKLSQLGLENGSRLADARSILLLVRGSELHKRIPVGITQRAVAFNQDVKCIKPSARLHPEFLLYWFLANEPMLLSKVESTSIGAGKLDSAVLGKLELPIPPLPEQKAIAHILGTLDDKIELNRRMNQTLEAMAQALFQSWFIDPVQDGLPKGWHAGTIAELCDINSWTLNKHDVLDRLEYVEISEVSRGDIASTHFYSRGKEPSRARRRLRHGDSVLSTVRPDRGAYFLCLNPSPSLVASTGFAVLTPTKAPWSFIHAAITQPELFEFLGHQADGGAYPAVNPAIIGKWEVALPNKPEKLDQFHAQCAPLYEQADKNRRQSRTLAALRDTLLPKLLSGELRVPDAEKFLEAHT